MKTDSGTLAEKRSTLYRYGFLSLGFILVGIGILGIFLPLLPTTIFLILASACFVKSSPRAHQWLKNHRWLGSYLKNYQEKSGLSIKSKVFTIIMLWASILVSAFVFTEEFYIRLLLLFIAAGVTIHLISIKTSTERS